VPLVSLSESTQTLHQFGYVGVLGLELPVVFMFNMSRVVDTINSESKSLSRDYFLSCPIIVRALDPFADTYE
jgi:hypothetical protein